MGRSQSLSKIMNTSGGLDIGHHRRLATRRNLRLLDPERLLFQGIRHHSETSLFLPGFEIPNSHHAALVIHGDNLAGVIMPSLYPTAVTIHGDKFLAVTGERQVVGIPFETGKAVHKLVGGDVVQADARAVIDPIGSLGIGELSALIPDGPGEKPAIGADR